MAEAPSRAALAFPVAVLAAIHLALIAGGWDALSARVLADADGYMRLLRVEELVNGGGWFATVEPRANIPYGLSLHWTRPFDLLVIDGALPLLPFLPLRDALYWSGALISPLLYLVALVVLMWAARPLLPGPGAVYAGILALALPAVHGYFAAGRADHHGLLAVLFLAVLGGAVRMATRPSKRGAMATGIAAALMLWVSVEALVAIGAVMAAFVALWASGFLRRAGDVAVFAAVLWLGTMLALTVERAPADRMTVEFDRISSAHAIVLLVAAAFWFGLHVAERRAEGRRAFVAAALGAMAAGLIVLTVPGFFGGPLADVPAPVMDLWYRTVREVRPLVSPAQPLRSARELVFLLGPALMALPAAAWLARDGGRDAGERAAWATVGIVLAAYTVLAVWQARFAMFAELAAVPAYAAVCLRVLDRWGGSGAAAVVAVRRAAIVVLFATGWLLAGAALYRLEGSPAARESCPVTAMARHLGTDPALSVRPRRYMAFLFDGPEILYRSPHSVVGAPYQRNVAGIYATHAFFTDATPGAADAHRLAHRLELDHVLVCRHGGEARHYLAAGAGGGRDGPTLFGRLRDDAPPDWLRAVALPETLSGDFALYTVVR